MAKAFNVNILGLSKTVHHFNFQLNDDFFKTYGQEVVAKGKFATQVYLDKRETFIEADFKIEGIAHLTCDRSLDEFDYSISINKKIVFKYGDEPQEVSDEIIVIAHDQVDLDLGQLMYEFISLEIPIKRLHPRFQKDEDKEGLVYSSETKHDEEKIDPRWEVLKKLK